MIKNVIKRDKRRVPYDASKIQNALLKAFEEVDKDVSSEDFSIIKRIVSEISEGKYPEEMSVEEIQDVVETKLMKSSRKDVAKAYINYRYLRNMARDQYKDLMDAVEEKLSAQNITNQNANVDEKSFGGRMGAMSSMVTKKFALERCMSKMARDNHLNNEIYIHDLDSYAVGMHNCLSIPFDDLLKNGFTTRQTDVRPAQSVNTAMQLIAVIFQLQSLQQFGEIPCRI